jgi:hypothetical protein
VGRAGEVREEAFELGERAGGTQLVEIVDDQHHGSGLLRELGEDRVDERAAVDSGDRGPRPGLRRRVERLADRIQQGEPELLRVLLVARHGHGGDAMSRA